MPSASLVHTEGADSQPTDSPLTCDPSEIFPARGARLPVSRPRRRPNFLGGKSERQPRASQRLIFSFKRQEHSCGAVNVRHAAVAASSELWVISDSVNHQERSRASEAKNATKRVLDRARTGAAAGSGGREANRLGSRRPLCVLPATSTGGFPMPMRMA